MSRLCRVCKKVFIRGSNAKSCVQCRDFDMIDSAVFINPKRFKKVNSKNFPDVGTLVSHLKDLFENQEGKCRYTGYNLKIPYSHPGYRGTGVICSPDRKDPRDEYSKKNIVLAQSRINIMKNDVESELDFYEICKRVIDYFEGKHSVPNFIDLNKLTDEEVEDLIKKHQK